MVSVKGDRGFHRLREYDDDLDNTDLTAQQKAVKRYQQTEKGKQATKRYHQSEGGKQKLNEAQFRYQNKPYYCYICNKHILIKSIIYILNHKNILIIVYTSIRI